MWGYEKHEDDWQHRGREYVRGYREFRGSRRQNFDICAVMCILIFILKAEIFKSIFNIFKISWYVKSFLN